MCEWDLVLFKKLEFKNLLNRFNKTEQTVNVSAEIEDKFKVIDDFAEADAIFEKAMQSTSNHIGFNLVVGEQVVGVSICFSEEDIYFIKASGFISVDYLVDKIRMMVDSQKSISMLNLKEQLQFLDVEEKKNIADLAIAAYLINPLKDSYDYDDIARDYLDLTVPSKDDLFKKNMKLSSMQEMEHEFRIYTGYLAYIPFMAYEVVMQELSKLEMKDLYVEIEMPLVYVLYDMQKRGIRVNRTALKEYGDQLSGRISELEQSIYEEVGETFNINSPKQLGVILFEKLRLPFAKKTKTGYSTNAEILEKLRCEHEVVGKILEYRQLTKLKSTYADGLAVYIKDDERIHGKFNQTITATGRISSTEPNLQNIPIRMELGRQIRKVFIPEDGFVFLDADYSQIELRVLAAISGDERLINAYKEGQDIHRITASEVFHTPFDEVTSLQRSNAKAVNFGIVYGISSFSLSQDLNITKKEADEYIKKYFDTYPLVKVFLEDTVAKAKETGYVTTLLHRRRPVPELSSSNFMQRSFGERIAMNSPIQGTAADIIKIAMIRVNRALKEQNLKSRLILQIHDELLIETFEPEVDIVGKILKSEMEAAIQLAVPMVAEVNQGSNWYEAK